MNKEPVVLPMWLRSKPECAPEMFPADLPANLPANPPARLSAKPCGNKPEVLTSRELECLEWAAAGKTSHEIADTLSLSESTVNFHLKNGMSKLDARNRSHAVAKAISSSLIAANW